MELSSEYSFPGQRQYLSAVPTDFRQRASSFHGTAAARPARPRHAHRRSAAVSEDLSGVDFSGLVKSQGMSSSVFERSPSRSPVLQNSDSDCSSGLECSGSPSARSKGPRVSFVEIRKPKTQPLELAPPILMSPAPIYKAEPSSPTVSLSESPTRHRRRLSFTNLFGKKKRDTPNTTPQLGSNSATFARSIHTPPEQFGFQPSPALSSPRHSFEEPEPPTIDLNAALSCRFPPDHILAEAPMSHESPFSKISKRLSYIDTVAEVEDEEEEGKGDITITAGTFGSGLSPVRTPQFDTIRSVPKLAIMDPIESPSILVARTSEDSFSGYSSSSSRHTDKENGLSQKPRHHHRRRRSLAAIFGRAN